MTRVDHLVIVAGGTGSRLAGIAGNLPKALVPIGGKPVLQHQLELALAAGMRDVTIYAGFLADRILEFAGDGSRFGLRVRVQVEDEPLGNAGALLRSLDSLPANFLVVYGDVMLAADLRALAARHLEREADLTAFAHPNDHPHDSDLLEVDAGDWVTAVHAYPHPADRFYANLVNAALYVVRRESLRPCAAPGRKRDFTKDILAGLVDRGSRVLAYRSSEYIKDMGTPERLRRVESDWQAGEIRMEGSDPAHAAVLLDRDGTLNVDGGRLRSAAGLKLIPGVGAALKSLRHAGFRLAILTNQPVIARGDASEAEVAAIHRRLEWELGKHGAYVDAIYVCPHHPDAGFPGERAELKIACDCRKPATGLFELARRDLNIDPARSWMVGDQTGDVEMARRAGLRSILVRTGMGGRDGRYPAAPDHVEDDLAGAAEVIRQHSEAALS